MATIHLTLEPVVWTPDGMRDAHNRQPDAILQQVMLSAEYHQGHYYWVNYQRMFSWNGTMYPWMRRQTAGSRDDEWCRGGGGLRR